MADYVDTKVSNLVINNLTQEKYDELLASGQINPDELYCTPDNIEEQLNAKADDNAVVHKSGDETINGVKTINASLQFTNDVSSEHAGFLYKQGSTGSLVCGLRVSTNLDWQSYFKVDTDGGFAVICKTNDLATGSSFVAKPDGTFTWGGKPIVRLVASQSPTSSNNYYWYRKYDNGWVEQGGRWAGSLSIAVGVAQYATVTLPVKMKDANYTATCTGGEGFAIPVGWQNKTVSSIQFAYGAYANAARTMTKMTWYVAGFAA